MERFYKEETLTSPYGKKNPCYNLSVYSPNTLLPYSKLPLKSSDICDTPKTNCLFGSTYSPWMPQPFICKPSPLQTQISLKIQSYPDKVVPTLLQPVKLLQPYQCESSVPSSMTTSTTGTPFTCASGQDASDNTNNVAKVSRHSVESTCSTMNVQASINEVEDIKHVRTSLENLLKELLSDGDISLCEEPVVNNVEEKPLDEKEKQNTDSFDEFKTKCTVSEDSQVMVSPSLKHGTKPYSVLSCIWNPLQFQTSLKKNIDQMPNNKRKEMSYCHKESINNFSKESNNDNKDTDGIICHLPESSHSLISLTKRAKQDNSPSSLFKNNDEQNTQLCKTFSLSHSTEGIEIKDESYIQTLTKKTKRQCVEKLTKEDIQNNLVPVDSSLQLHRSETKDCVKHHSKESLGQYMFDARLYFNTEPESQHCSKRCSAEYSCSYPGVSWNTRMQSWLVYFEDAKKRKSRTFNPKRISEAQLSLLPVSIQKKILTHVRVFLL
jgi:hypothetical protein